MVLPDSRKVPRAPRYLGAVKASPPLFAYGTLTRCGGPFQTLRLRTGFLTCLSVSSLTNDGPTTPQMQRLPAITHLWFRLLRVRSPLLAQSLLFSSRPATKMFQFTGCPLSALCVQAEVSWITMTGYPIRRSPDQRLIAAPRGISSLATSFIGPLPQGIHRAPFVASNQNMLPSRS